MQQDTRRPVAVVLVEQGGQTTEITTPVDYFKGEGFTTLVTVPICAYGSKPILDKHGIPVKYNATLENRQVKTLGAQPETYDTDAIDIVVIPGGWQLPEKLRMNHDVLAFLKFLDSNNKTIIASVCHGPSVLISAGLLRGKTISAYEGIKDDIQNAGAIWHPGPVCTFGRYVTAPHYDYMGPFMKEVLRVYYSQHS